MLFPAAIVHSEWFAILTAVVAINTLMYAALAVAKILPKIYVSDWIRRRNKRSETRSIHPEDQA
ncbi:hypothetical protein IV498_17435 [Paenarthrobacter sp. Z7-10]|nr:hypothetical protein [Paenarthrobacter sp. Z7-10]